MKDILNIYSRYVKNYLYHSYKTKKELPTWCKTYYNAPYRLSPLKTFIETYMGSKIYSIH